MQYILATWSQLVRSEESHLTISIAYLSEVDVPLYLQCNTICSVCSITVIWLCVYTASTWSTCKLAVWTQCLLRKVKRGMDRFILWCIYNTSHCIFSLPQNGSPCYWLPTNLYSINLRSCIMLETSLIPSWASWTRIKWGIVFINHKVLYIYCT